MEEGAKGHGGIHGSIDIDHDITLDETITIDIYCRVCLEGKLRTLPRAVTVGRK